MDNFFLSQIYINLEIIFYIILYSHLKSEKYLKRVNTVSENDFQPYTPQLGISGSSYQLQMGQVNGFWAIRLVKGTSVLASKVFNDSPEPEELPLGRYLTGWVLSVLAIPNINTYQIQKVVGFLRSKARDNFDEQQKKRQSAGKSERNDVHLEKVPENVQVKRPQAKGWVKEDKGTSTNASAANLSPALAASNRSATGEDQGHGTVGSRKLPAIPVGEGFVIRALAGSVGRAGVSRSSTPGNIDIGAIQNKLMHSSGIQDLIHKVSNLEQRIIELEKSNRFLKEKLRNSQ